MKTPRFLPLLFVAALGTAASNAATVTYSNSRFVTESGSLGSNPLTLSKFDSSLGTLTKVEVTVSLSLPSFDIVVDNDSANPATVTVTFGTVGSVGFTSSASTYNGINTLSGSDFSIATQNSTFTVGAQAGDLVDEFNNDNGSDNGSFITTAVLVGQMTPRQIDSGVWNQYIGTDDIVYDIAADFITDMNVNSGGGGGEVRYQGTIPSATFFTQVTYTYEAIPEPSAALLGGIGLLGLLRRRR